MVSGAVIFPPLFLPPIDWFATAMGKAVILDGSLRYERQTEMHRCRIKGPSGPQSLIVPVKKQSKYGPLREAVIDNSRNWSRPMRASLKTAYGRAPFFQYYEGLLEQLVPEEYLMNLNQRLIGWLFDELGWPAPVVDATVSAANAEKSGQSLPQHFTPLPYWQPFGAFAPNLSVVDALFQLGPGLTDYLLRCTVASKEP